MSKIGYAVFGRPRGHVVLSNGLFKELELDNSLYLNDSHIKLDKKEQTILIRRIPTDQNNLDKKDGYLVVIYEHGLQQLENRDGGYIGSAICFKENTVDASKLAQGLFYLFTEIKKYVDADNRFKSTDGSDWKINLPDPNGKFGIILDESLNYSPFQKGRENNSVKINNIQHDILGLLTHFCLNQQYHHIDYLYASNKDSVISKLKSNGLAEINFTSLFNYTEAGKRLDKKIKEASLKLKNTDEEIRKKISQFDILEQEKKKAIQSINNEGSSLSKKLEQYKNQEKQARIKHEENQSLIDNDKKEIERLKEEIQKLGNKNLNSLKKEKAELVNELDRKNLKIGQSLEALENHISKKVRKESTAKSFSDEFEKIIYFQRETEKARKRNKFLKLLLSGLLLLSLVFITYLYFTKKENTPKPNQQIAAPIKESSEGSKLLSELKKYNVKDTLGLKKHQEYVFKTLDGFDRGNYKNEEELKTFIKERKWNYWELYYNDSLNYSLLEHINKKHGDSSTLEENGYLLNILKNSDSAYVEYCGFEDKDIKKALETYKTGQQHVFKKVPQPFKNNKEMSQAYFELLIRELNGDKLNKAKVGRVELLYIK